MDDLVGADRGSMSQTPLIFTEIDMSDNQAALPGPASFRNIESDRLQTVSKLYEHLGSPIEQAVRRAALGMIKAHSVVSKPKLLELGCSDGYMTSLLNVIASEHVVVEAASDFIDKARSAVPEGVTFIQALFEEYEPARQFDLVIMSFILEHVADPSDLIARARHWLTPDTGRIIAIVPNIRAFSRQLGRAIGVVGELAEITPSEAAHGHRRSYDRISFDRDVERGGAEILARGGLVVKPFANTQMDLMLHQGIIGEDQLLGLERLGAEYPDLCHSIYVVAR
jgi:2-polyprenyl-3-methyl-5-hydroxy-6-metoxy-1,4-benzoquinol methylase